MWTAALPVFAWSPVLATSRVRVRVWANATDVQVMARSGGSQRVLETGHVDGSWQAEVSLTDATWLWVEGDVEVVEWEVDEEPDLPRVTAVVPTFGRPVEAATQTRALLEAEIVGHVVVIDQDGGLADDATFARLQHLEPDRVLLVTQDNLGGSGGYARGMLESLRWPHDAVFLSDDDALIDAESLRRMVVLQALATEQGQRCIVGTGMRSAEQPELLISLNERVEPKRFWWCPADGLTAPLDLSSWPTGWDRLVPDRALDFAGWWGALLPPGTVADVGLPVPYFLKWDDPEYGLRARRRGYVVRALPGVAVRHPTWAAKGTAASWASYPMHRNRLATAAAYGAGRGVLLDSLLHQVKHVLSLQYATAELWQHGARTMLAGPQAWLGTDLHRVRPEAQRILDAMPAPGPEHADGRTDDRAPSLVRALSGLWRRVAPTAIPFVRVSPLEFSWRVALGADRVVIVDAEDNDVAVLQRDPRRARRLLIDIARTHLRLATRWRELSGAYRRALPRTWTPEFWTPVLGAEPDRAVDDERR